MGYAMNATDIMTRQVVTAKTDTSVSEIAHLMLANRDRRGSFRCK